MLLFLLTLLYGCNAVSLKKFIGSPRNVTTRDSMNFLETIKADPKKFVSEAEKLDPAALQNVIGLLEDLLLSSQAREDHLVGELDAANTALDAANGEVINAEDALATAQARTGAAIAAVTVASDALDVANNEKAAADANEAAVSADLEAKRDTHAQKATAVATAQTAHDDEIDSLNNEQQILQQVIDMLNGLPDASVSQWQEVASAGGNTRVDDAFYNAVCGNFNDLTTSDIILVQMGEVKDYFHPGQAMSMCHFLLNQDYSWSATEDGTYVTPSMYGHHFGGSAGNWPQQIDGRAYLSFWGSRDGGSIGGCCHDRSNNYGGVDGAAWHRAFTVSVKYV